MKFSTPVCLRLFKFFIASAAIFAFSSCSNAEEEGTVSLNIPSSFCEQIAARPPFSGTSTGGAATEMKVFVTGDHEARKTVWLTPGDNITLQFDGIKVGSYIHVVLLVVDESASSDSCTIGISDEIPIYGKYENSVAPRFNTLNLSYTDAFDNENDPGDCTSTSLLLDRDLPGCTYKWEFGNGPTIITSGAKCTSSPHTTMGYSYCTIYCDGTEITTLGISRA